ncbi:MAG: flippase [Bacteroidetes bacterium HGW-Bacteroidetes-5]|jgi:O-antigen/teichoic acid export membrane protein|nr:MAG: flippase [Bacteroidetes bacterium HGW-Bacteroidetes-5]
MSSLKKKAFDGLIWSSIERFSAQGIQFFLGIILARLLLPEDYGLVGMLAIFFAISVTIIDSGFSTALIQKKNRDEKDFSTVFYFNIVVAFVFYLLLFLIAPLIADFYRQPLLISLTRVIGLTLIINSFAVVQRAKFAINIDFKTQTKASIFSIIISGIIGIYLAYDGYGVWALVIQELIRSTLNIIILWYYSKWLPIEGFHFDRFKLLFSFGSKLLISGLINTIYDNIYLIIIGKIYSTSSLGFYTRAKQLNDFPSSNLTGIIQRVTYPLLSELQDNNDRLKETYRKMIKMTALIIFPLMIGLAALADPLIRVILTEKWVNTIWMLQLLCFAGMWYPIHALNLNILYVKGRSDLFLRLEIIKKTIITLVLVISIPFGIEAMIIGQIFTSYVALIINTYYTKQIIAYGLFQQLSDIIKVLLLSFAMGYIIYITMPLINTSESKLIVGILEGAIFYISIAWLFNIGEIKTLPSFIKQK